jgi:hypothetical protein
MISDIKFNESIGSLESIRWERFGICKEKISEVVFNQIVEDNKKYHSKWIIGMLNEGENSYIDDVDNVKKYLNKIVTTKNNYICTYDLNSGCFLRYLYMGLDYKVHLSKMNNTENPVDFSIPTKNTRQEVVEYFIKNYNLLNPESFITDYRLIY